MAAFGYSSTTATVNDGRAWRTYTTTTSNNTTCRVTVYYTTTTTNCYSAAADVRDEPKPTPEYVALGRMAVAQGPRKGQIPVGRSLLAALPRGKVKCWRSLNEKRIAWGQA